MRYLPDILELHRRHFAACKNQDHWYAAAEYLHEIGDDEAALEALNEADYWREEAELIEMPYRH